MAEQLLTGTLSLNTNKASKITFQWYLSKQTIWTILLEVMMTTLKIISRYLYVYLIRMFSLFRDHFFDLPSRKKKSRNVKHGLISRPGKPAYGELGVRPYHRRNDSNETTRPHTRRKERPSTDLNFPLYLKEC